MALNAHLLTWLAPRVGGAGGVSDPHLDQLTSHYYGASQAKASQMRRRQMSNVGGSNAPLYLYSDGGHFGRRSCPLDVVGLLRQDERIAGYADVLGVVDCQKKIVALKIRDRDTQGKIHGGFLKDGHYYLPGQTLNTHLSWVRFLKRPSERQDDGSGSGGGIGRDDDAAECKTNRAADPSSAFLGKKKTRMSLTTPPAAQRAELMRFIRHNIRTADSSFVSASSHDMLGSATLRARRARDTLPRPKYGLTSHDLIAKTDHDPMHWMRRVYDLAKENRYRNCVLDRKDFGWGNPLVCIGCGRYEHDCHNANCMYERGLVKGANTPPKQPYMMPYELARGGRRQLQLVAAENCRRIAIQQAHNISSLDSELLSRITRLAIDDEASKRTMPNIDKESFKEESKTFEMMNAEGREQAKRLGAGYGGASGHGNDNELELEWHCGVCAASNPSAAQTCSVCSRPRGKSLDRKKAAAGFLAKLTKGLLGDGAVKFDGKEEKAAAAERRRERVLARQIEVAQKKNVQIAKDRAREERRLEKEEEEAEKEARGGSGGGDGYDLMDERGAIGVVKRFGRGMAYARSFNALRSKGAAASIIKRLFGTDYTDAVEDATLEGLRKGHPIQYKADSLKMLLKKQGGFGSDSSGSESSDSDDSSSSSSDSDSSSSDDDDEEEEE